MTMWSIWRSAIRFARVDAMLEHQPIPALRMCDFFFEIEALLILSFPHKST
jgi:hypothetical protein